jgi:hypothetical protein
MRKLLILSVVLLLAISSCNKASTTTPTIPTVPGTISVDINGVPDSFNINASAIPLSGLYAGIWTYGISVAGTNGIGADPTHFSFDIGRATPLTVGQYSNSVASNDAIFFYNENDSAQYESVSNSPDSIEITVTSIDSVITHRVQGTFHGLGLNVSLGPMTTDTFTNGKFDVPLSN